MTQKLTWEVIEDNAGGLHLAVTEGSRVVYYNYSYEHMAPEDLLACLAALDDGEDPRTDGWDVPADVDDPQAWYDSLQIGEISGGVVVADQDGIYYDRMGAAARLVFGDCDEGLEQMASEFCRLGLTAQVHGGVLVVDEWPAPQRFYPVKALPVLRRYPDGYMSTNAGDAEVCYALEDAGACQ